MEIQTETQDDLLQKMEKVDKEKCEMELKVAELKQKQVCRKLLLKRLRGFKKKF